jgi:hypoxanthine phosphoribosyltransferase
VGVNDLNHAAIGAFFNKQTKIAAILSGGAIYAEIGRKILERYADPSIELNICVVAVDKKNRKAIFEKSENDQAVPEMVIVDDVINEGGTVVAALFAAGEYFPQATIRSSQGTDRPGAWHERVQESHMLYLDRLFYTFGDLFQNRKKDDAMNVFNDALAYANTNKVKLRGGWYRLKERMEKGKWE